MNTKLFLSGLIFFFGFSTFSQNDSGNPTAPKISKVKNNIYVLQSDGGNIGVSFGKDGIFMIDDQFSGDREELNREIKKISEKPIRFVVNTHFHNDHTAGNPKMAKEGAVIFAQEKVRERLITVINEEKRKVSDNMLPMVTFTKDLSFYFNNEKIYVFHVPNAHTDGDVMVYFTGSNVLQTGDVFVNGLFPFIDVENGGTVLGYLQGIQQAISIIDQETKIIPGHGPMATYKDLVNAQRLLEVIYKKVGQLVVLGKTEEEVTKSKELTKEYDAMGYSNGFVNSESFLRTLYNEASQRTESKEERLKKNEEALQKYEQIKKKHDSKKS